MTDPSLAALRDAALQQEWTTNLWSFIKMLWIIPAIYLLVVGLWMRR